MQGSKKMKMLSPVVGGWYKDLQNNALFEVVAWDPSALTIEAQYLDGAVTEYDLDGWRELLLEHAEPPEDWRTAYELDDEDGLVDPIGDMTLTIGVAPTVGVSVTNTTGPMPCTAWRISREGRRPAGCLLLATPAGRGLL